MSTKDYNDEDTITISCSDTSDFDNMATSLNVSSAALTSGLFTHPTYTYTTNGTTGYSQPWVTTTGAPSTLEVKGDANFEGDIKFKGRSLQELFSKIEDRLVILQPDPAKLEKYEALRKAYDHYKLLEKLVQED
jgi:hypothetical protein